MANIDPSILNHLSQMQPELYWLDEDPLEPMPHPTLIGDVRSDLCIVGAGYTGLWTALLAKEANPEREVVVVRTARNRCGRFRSQRWFLQLLTNPWIYEWI